MRADGKREFHFCPPPNGGKVCQKLARQDNGRAKHAWMPALELMYDICMRLGTYDPHEIADAIYGKRKNGQQAAE